MVQDLSKQDNSQLRVNLNPVALEADVAYFSARLELVGNPETRYQVAQLKVYQVLADALAENLQRLSGKV